MFYFVKTPEWLKKLYSNAIWEIPDTEKNIYLTFDDGPHPAITPYILDELKNYNAQATFFCIGKNVQLYPNIFDRILAEEHAVGNHTQDHLNGWKTNTVGYLANIKAAKKHIPSTLFRPPYGRIKRSQMRLLTAGNNPMQIIMWSVLSGDFDLELIPERCLNNVIKNTKSGSIVVFHDSEKAEKKVRYALPKVLDHFSNKGFMFKKIASL